MTSKWKSPSSRRAWIEIGKIRHAWRMQSVALLAEGVDRNCPCFLVPKCLFVALLAEGVDRNRAVDGRIVHVLVSPSSRRAWIEIRFTPLAALLYPRRPPRGGRG